MVGGFVLQYDLPRHDGARHATERNVLPAALGKKESVQAIGLEA